MLLNRSSYIYHIGVISFLMGLLPYIFVDINRSHYIYFTIIFLVLLLSVLLFPFNIFLVDLCKLRSYNIHDKLCYHCEFVEGDNSLINRIYIKNSSIDDNYYELDKSLFCYFDSDIDYEYYVNNILVCDEVHKLLKCINRKLSVKRNYSMYESYHFNRNVLYIFCYIFLFIFLLIFSFLYFNYI